MTIKKKLFLGLEKKVSLESDNPHFRQEKTLNFKLDLVLPPFFDAQPGKSKACGCFRNRSLARVPQFSAKILNTLESLSHFDAAYLPNYTFE